MYFLLFAVEICNTINLIIEMQNMQKKKYYQVLQHNSTWIII